MVKRLSYSSVQKAVDDSSTPKLYKNMKKFVKKCFNRKERPLTLHIIEKPMQKDSFHRQQPIISWKKSPKRRMRFRNGNCKALLSEPASN
jgi:hypothetical protein